MTGTDFDFGEWLPMMPMEGPPFPRIFGIKWPWVEEDDVIVSVLNPPAGAELWQLTLCDWDITAVIHESGGGEHIAITQAASFDVPDGLVWPLRIISLQIVKWNPDHTAVIQLYYVQSMHPTLWDWDLEAYGNVPDPTYREAFIPGIGEYSYNVTAGSFQ